MLDQLADDTFTYCAFEDFQNNGLRPEMDLMNLKPGNYVLIEIRKSVDLDLKSFDFCMLSKDNKSALMLI